MVEESPVQWQLLQTEPDVAWQYQERLACGKSEARQFQHHAVPVGHCLDLDLGTVMQGGPVQ